VSLTDLIAIGRPILHLFVDPGCGPCAALLPEAAVCLGGQGKSGHLSTVQNRPFLAATETHGVLLRAVLVAQVGLELGAPTPRPALEHMRVM
jgi:hypothetical protein